MAKAPAEVVEGVREKYRLAGEQIEKMEASLANIEEGQ